MPFVFFAFLLVFTLFESSFVSANEQFLNLRHKETFMRSGNSKKHPVVAVYRKRGLPFQVLTELKQQERVGSDRQNVIEVSVWFRVQDYEGQTGWIHFTQLSRQKRLMVLPPEGMIEVPMYAEKNASKPVALMPRHLIVVREECAVGWCLVRYEDEEHGTLEGFIDRAFLWGDTSR